jgi:hypothetical protein
MRARGYSSAQALFDLDGPLVDSAPEIYAAIEHAWESHMTALPFPRERFRIGPPLPEALAALSQPVDMRIGFERLGGMVREPMGYEPRAMGRRTEGGRVARGEGGSVRARGCRAQRREIAAPGGRCGFR